MVYAKGYKISIRKIAEAFKFPQGFKDPKISLVVEYLIHFEISRDAYEYLGSVVWEEEGKPWTELVLVIEDDDDQNALRKRDIGKPHPRIEKVMDVLDGPDTWELWG